MKMIAEYLDNAFKFERIAAEEPDPRLKAQFEGQAVAHRKLAFELGLPPQPQFELDPRAWTCLPLCTRPCKAQSLAASRPVKSAESLRMPSLSAEAPEQ